MGVTVLVTDTAGQSFNSDWFWGLGLNYDHVATTANTIVETYSLAASELSATFRVSHNPAVGGDLT